MGSTASVILSSIRCNARLWTHGVRSPIVTCEGRVPILHCDGEIKIRGRLAVRSGVARCELGAMNGGRLDVGARVFVNQGASIVASTLIVIGDDVRVGDFAAIYDTDYHQVDASRPVKHAPVLISANVWLGRAVIVLPGSKIGEHSVVAAGSVVRGEIPERVLVAGNPAQVVRKLRIPEGWRRG